MPDETVDPLSDNAALNALVTELEALAAFVGGKYDRVTGDANFVLVTDAGTYLRSARATGVKTAITNNGPNECVVRENGVIIALVPAGETKVLPLAGKGPLKVNVAAGETANIAVATFNKD